MSTYRGRFAPSPTGRLHFGSLVAAVASHAQARVNDGVWIVRMEDLDRPREVAGMADALISDLATFGMRSDEPVMYQSRRDDAYAAALEQLRERGLIFACSCSRRELKAHAVYPGFCRDGVSKKGAAAVRVLATDQLIEHDDAVLGTQAQNIAADVGDFIIKRTDGLFAYQLAVVLDDAEQGITEVVRGADLLDSTPRQIYLQQLLGLPTPDYAHVPLALDGAGNKLSKQSKARPVDPNEPVGGLLAAWKFLGQAAPDSTPTSVESFWQFAIDRWSLERLRPKGQAIPSMNPL